MEDNNGPRYYQQNQNDETVGKFQEQNLHQIAQTNTTINRFLSAFIDHVISILFIHCDNRTHSTQNIEFFSQSIYRV